MAILKTNNSFLKANGKILSSPVSGVRIGANIYPYIQIGTLLWTTKPLKEIIGTHYIYSQETLDTYGVYYDKDTVQNATKIPSLMHDGWRVARYNDWSSLRNALGGNSEAVKQFFSGDLQLKGAGFYRANGIFWGIGDAFVWTGDSFYIWLRPADGHFQGDSYWGPTIGCPIRLCKNVT